MPPDRETYALWQERYRAIDDRVDGRYRDWIGAVIALATEVDRDCHDIYVTGPARTARNHAEMFRDAKQAAKIDQTYKQFRNSWQAFGRAINFHLRD